MAMKVMLPVNRAVPMQQRVKNSVAENNHSLFAVKLN
jgi:hypothetical protein